MKYRRTIVAIVLVATILPLTGCVGPCNLTGKLNDWNNDLGDRWVNEIVFIVLLPVYGLTVLGDVLIFNAVEFWGGDNPVHNPS